MSTTALSREELVKALSLEWATLNDLLSALPEHDWTVPTSLPGWTVQDVVAHIVGTESMLAGYPTPEYEQAKQLPHVHNEIAATNEQWVQDMRSLPGAQVLDRFRAITTERTRALRSMTQQDFDAPSWTPAGQSTYGRFMRIRVFDCWLHEQDIRDALRLPGHESGDCPQTAIAEITDALGYLIGKRAGAADGTTVTIALTGPVCRDINVAVDGRASVVPTLPAPATVTLRLTSSLFTRLAGGRVKPDAHRAEVTIEGDTELGERIVDNLAYTI